MQVCNLMTPDPVTVTPRDTLGQAKAAMDKGGFRRVLVVENGKLVGILTERDIREHAGYLDNTRVSAAMRTELLTATPQASVEQAARLILKHKVGGLPIVENGNLVGIVTTSDLLRAFLTIEHGP